MANESRQSPANRSKGALSALDDLSVQPSHDQVATVLGPSMQAWSDLEGWLNKSAGIDNWAWGSSGKKYGWGLRARTGKRNVAYLIPQHGSFLVGLVLGDRAVQAVRESSVSQAALDLVAGARRYGEGTGFRVPVTSVEDLEDIKILITIKVTH